MTLFADKCRIKRNLEELNDNLLRRLECPVCNRICRPPIYSCANGHSACKKCKGRITECALCHGPRPDTRNRLAEELLTKALLPCKYSKDGCKERFNLQDLAMHVARCKYRFKCRVHLVDAGSFGGVATRCRWHGRRADLTAHVRKKHPHHYDVASGAAISVPIMRAPAAAGASGAAPLRLEHAHLLDSNGGPLFWWILCVEETAAATAAGGGGVGRISGKMYVKHLGPTRYASRYKCRMELSSGDGEQRFVFCTQVMKVTDHVTGGLNNVQLNGDMMDLFVVNGVFECRIRIVTVR